MAFAKVALLVGCILSNGHGRRLQATQGLAVRTPGGRAWQQMETVGSTHALQSLAELEQSSKQASIRKNISPMKELALLVLASQEVSAFSPGIPSIKMPVQAAGHQTTVSTGNPYKRWSAVMMFPDNARSKGRANEPDSEWPAPGKRHRFIEENDPTLEQYARHEGTGYVCKTPDELTTSRARGSYPGSYRVSFTLPGLDDEPKTLELLKSKNNDNPSFGAVRVKLPFDAWVRSVPFSSRSEVLTVPQDGNAQRANLKKGDIIRAMSTPVKRANAQDGWYHPVVAVPRSQNGLVFLDGRLGNDYNSVLIENLRRAPAEVVLIVERPVDDGKGAGGLLNFLSSGLL